MKPHYKWSWKLNTRVFVGWVFAKEFKIVHEDGFFSKADTKFAENWDYINWCPLR